MADRTMLRPADTDGARLLVVRVTAVEKSHDPRSDAVLMAFELDGAERYVWLDAEAVGILRRRRGVALVGSLVPLELRRVRNPRTRAMVDRYRVARHAAQWTEAEEQPEMNLNGEVER